LNIRIFFSLALAGTLLAACGGSKPAIQQPAAQPVSTARPDSISMEIFSLAHDTSIAPFVKHWPREERTVEDTATIDDGEVVSAHMIYRIQIFTSVNFADATAVRDDAVEQFGGDVRVDFETPYYKVRIGAFKSPDEAEPLLKKARRLGYRGAWLVRVRAPEGDDGP